MKYILYGIGLFMIVAMDFSGFGVTEYIGVTAGIILMIFGLSKKDN